MSNKAGSHPCYGSDRLLYNCFRGANATRRNDCGCVLLTCLVRRTERLAVYESSEFQPLFFSKSAMNCTSASTPACGQAL